MQLHLLPRGGHLLCDQLSQLEQSVIGVYLDLERFVTITHVGILIQHIYRVLLALFEHCK